MNDLKDFLKNVWIFIAALLGEVYLWLSDFGIWLMKSVPMLNAIIQFCMALILVVYAFKIFVYNIELPIIGSIVKKIKKSIGMKNKNIMTIELADEMASQGKDSIVEEKMKRQKTVLILIFVLLKKGFKIMRKVFKNIFKWIYYNKFTLLGVLSLLAVAVAVFLRITKPELVNGFIADRDLLISLGGLISYGLFSIFGYGAESFEKYEKRVGDKETQKKYEAEQKARLKDELERNKLVNVIQKEIETNVIPILKERLIEEAKSGVKTGYRNITDNLYPELKWEYIVADLGEDEIRIDALIKSIDELARKHNLIEVRKVIEGGRQVSKEVNLILEEIKAGK